MTTNASADSIEEQTDEAVRELTELKAQGKKAQAHLEQLNQAVEIAENRLDRTDSGRLVEVNQNLVVSAIRAQTDADICAEQLKHVSQSAALDVLTELPNRALLLDRFKQAIAVAKRDGDHMAIFFVDMNNFKEINDTLGHAVGDKVLQHAARCMTSVVREVDTVSRQGGDEFLILLTGISHGEAKAVAHKIASALGAPCRIGEHLIRLSASIGICLYPDDGDTPELLIDRADAAMYRAKRHGMESFVFHSDEFDEIVPHASAALATRPNVLVHYDEAVAEHERRVGELSEANKQLVMAALSAEDLRAAAEQSQKRHKEFLALVAHELRNPLVPLGVAASLLRGCDPKDLERMQAIIEQQVAQITRLTGDLLHFSRVSTGKLRLHFRTVELATIIEDAVNASRPAIDTRLQHFRVQTPVQPVTLEADPIRVVQILSNLLDNASKYTPVGGEISLTADIQDEVVVIRVADNGIGISADSQGRVFELFAQDANATGFNSQGLGIGLAVVKELVEGHGGSVIIVSEGVGFGSEFVLTLPLNRSQAQD